MAKKGKPYSDINRSRTLPNNNGKGNNKSNPKKNNNRSYDKGKKLENTTKIRVDKFRLNDSESLDTSFLEARVQNKINKDKKGKEKILKETEQRIRGLSILKSIFYCLSLLCIIILVILVFMNHNFHKPNEEKLPVEVVEEKKVEKTIDDNYLFVGDIHTENLPLDEIPFLYPYVKVAQEDMSTQFLLDHLHEKVYVYNPSVIFLEVGLEDFIQESSLDDILTRYDTILTNIQENRPNAHIYVESLYPIYSDVMEEDSRYLQVDNDMIQTFNEKLKTLVSNQNVHYVDLYSVLMEDNHLKSNYTEDGYTLNSDGYKRIWKVFQKIVDDEK